MLKLHLGCGLRYLDGYVNIDYPSSEHSVQHAIVADFRVDLLQLHYERSSVDEVRLHHVFEHFPRPVALGLLCRWRDWLKPGGILRIETPDLMASAWLLASPFVSSDERQEVVRHLFGSHEAGWAAHWDGWYRERFRLTLLTLGFSDLRFQRTRWGRLRNIEVMARRGDTQIGAAELRPIIRGLLEKSLVKHRAGFFRQATAESERALLEIWLMDWERIYRGSATEPMAGCA